MTQIPFCWRLLPLFAASGFFFSCVAPGTVGQFAPRNYAQTMDSATSACLRNPACYAPPPGESAILPWLSRAIEALSSATAALKLLEAADLAKIEQVLKDCANQANHDVNERLLGQGQRPTRQLCQQTFQTDPGGNKVTWAMHLGREKHQAAMECVQKELPKALSDNLSLQPTYRYNKQTKKLDLLDPKQVEEWLRSGWFYKLIGTLIPDVVVHAAGDLLNIQAVYDFKFPCPTDNPASWHKYHKDHPYYPSNQQEMYEEAFKVAPLPVRPGFGVGQ
jgi:hypothetical protein